MNQKELLLTLENQKLRLEVLSHDYDIEVAHIDADDILIETIELLAKAKFDTIPREVSAIISEYRSIPKWYA